MVKDYKIYAIHAEEVMLIGLLNATARWCNETMGIDLFEQLSEKISVGDVLNHLSSMLMKSVVCIGFTFLIYMFLLYGSSMRTFEKSSIRYKIENQITRYLIIKTVLSLLAGTISYCIYGVFLHVPMAFIFAMLFFALNFIPHIGPIIATCIPVPLVLFDPRFTNVQIILAIALPSIMNFILQDFIEPKVLGDSLHLHPIVVIVCLVVWAIIWGSIGAVFAVPLTACVKIALHNVDHPYAKIVDAWLAGDFCCVHIHDNDEKQEDVIAKQLTAEKQNHTIRVAKHAEDQIQLQKIHTTRRIETSSSIHPFEFLHLRCVLAPDTR
ncbi:hypothetical protein JH06_1183 [Blastocystis sp. subtype 4]|uniref:hypothetical protein n=1 Tax=Blastocystis sp. subtype 4 TaxID=944170 RepID=UPI000711C9C8|nr:hypothetical protein JH06_1183 [Blastocystis sp. subtype 4]KNB45609.1 hypothetical protein JH06_1183 [Blastocystis sp. subtype 4]|eukprot:XP_014529052.1 hypothetical protein JH06_1183 [Blastocystis sp. subtype 4]